MKYLITILCFLLFINFIVYSQDKASPLTKIFMMKNHSALKTNSPLSGKKLSGMIKVNANFKYDDILSSGIKIRTRAGNIFTFSIDENRLVDLYNYDGIDYIQLDEPVSFEMDSARRQIGANIVHSGLGETIQGFSGKGVIVGIVDSGFDYSHPVFYDSANGSIRIKKVWEQRKEGTPPSSYDYGNELLTEEDMLSERYDITTSSHGTHVGGIAAGNSNGSNGIFKGIAYEADLVFVGIRPNPEEWMSTGMSSFVDAYQYIFDYADEQGKPAVINTSWGIAIGPRDGSSLFNQACNNMIKPGRALTFSGGNSGGDNLHLNYAFNGKDTMFRTTLVFNPNFPEKYTWLDCWVDPDKTYQLSFDLYNFANKTFSNMNASVDTKESSLGSFLLTNEQGDSCRIDYAVNKVDFNGRTRMFFIVSSYTEDKLVITGKGNDGELHLWSGIVHQYRGYPSTFASLALPWAINGNKKNVVNDLSTADSVFSCAAYTSKIRFTNASGSNMSAGTAQVGRIAPFSSNGPATNGKMKPDIAAPGFYVVAAVSSADENYKSQGENYDMTVSEIIGDDYEYRFAALAGTSMAAPNVAGAIALLFEADPNLSTAQIRHLLTSTALQNQYYSNSTIWGAGAIRIDEAMRMLLGISSIDENYKANSSISANCINGNTINVNVNAHFNGNLTLHLYDLQGNLLLRNEIQEGETEISLNAQYLSNGIYLIRAFNKFNDYKTKVVVVR